MIAVDTNVLVRIFIDDLEIKQVEKARALAKKSKTLYLPHVVLVEMIWVLIRVYHLKKTHIIHVLQEINDNASFVVENESVFTSAFENYKTNNVDFSDCMILASVQAAGVEKIYTFDEKFSRLKDVHKL